MKLNKNGGLLATKSTKKHEKKKNTLVPKLRFPEFQKAEAWDSKSLNTILFFTDRKVMKPDKPYTRLGIRSHGKGTFLVYDEVPEKNAMDYLYEVKQNDLIVNITFAWEGAIAIVSKNDEGALVSHRFPTYVFNESEAIPNFFKYLMIDKYFIYKLGVISPGGAGRNRVLSKTDFLKLKVNIPKTVEQQKIADCLTSLDELITAEGGKLKAYKDHKKALMQKLFPAEGQTIPEWRFPEFRDAGEWCLYSFGNLVKIFSGKGFKASEYSENGIRLLQIENVGYGITKWSTDSVKLPHHYGIDYSELMLKERDIVLALNRPVTNNELKIVQLRSNDVPAILYQRVGKMVIVSKLVIDCFIYHLSRIFIKEYVIKQSVGSDQPFISITDLYAQIIRIPTILEQQKIADCLSSLDELIGAQGKKVEILKLHKKGLMQGLFPSADEVEQ